MLVTILLTAVNAVMPIVLLILLGFFLRQKGFLTEGFVKTGNKLVFRVCLPCMLFINVYEMSSMDHLPWDIVIYCTAAVLVLFLIGMAVSVATTRDHRRRGVIWQCCFRSNYAIIGSSLSAALGGPETALVSTLILAITVPLFNVFSVIALEVFSQDTPGKKNTPREMIGDILRNPLILGVVLGGFCLALRGFQQVLFDRVVFSLSRDLKFAYAVLQNIKSMATPLALLVLGGQFRFSVVGGMFKEIAVGTLFRVVAAPVLGIGAALLLQLTGILNCTQEAIPAMLALFGSPVAVSSAVMAGEMHNDEQLATQLVVWTSIASVVTIFAFSCLLMGLGLIAV